jgi:hypothetical protein
LIRKLNHVFVDIENSGGLSPNELLMHLDGVKLSQKIAVASENTPSGLEEKWLDSPFRVTYGGSDPDAADHRLINEVMRQINLDERDGRPPANIHLAVTGDTDFCDLISILTRLGHEVSIIGWGKVHNKLRQLATSSINLRKPISNIES